MNIRKLLISIFVVLFKEQIKIVYNRSELD